MPIKKHNIVPTSEDILAVGTAYRNAYSAQHAFTVSARLLGKTIFELERSIVYPDADVALEDGRTIPLHDVSKALSQLSTTARQSEENDVKSIIANRIDSILDETQHVNPDFGDVLVAVSTANYYLTGQENPPIEVVRGKNAWLDQTNPEHIIAGKSGEHYRRHRAVYEQQALTMASAVGIQINYDAQQSPATNVRLEGQQNWL